MIGDSLFTFGTLGSNSKIITKLLCFNNLFTSIYLANLLLLLLLFHIAIDV